METYNLWTSFWTSFPQNHAPALFVQTPPLRRALPTFFFSFDFLYKNSSPFAVMPQGKVGFPLTLLGLSAFSRPLAVADFALLKYQAWRP